MPASTKAPTAKAPAAKASTAKASDKPSDKASARPAASRPTRPARPARDARRGPRRGGTLTVRAAVLALAVCTLVVSAALPLREFLAQRGAISELEQEQQQAKARVAALEAERERLQDPAYVKAEARRRLHFVLPGETAYVLLQPSPAPDATVPNSRRQGGATGPDAPWWSQVWGSVQSADRPAPAPPQAPAP